MAKSISLQSRSRFFRLRLASTHLLISFLAVGSLILLFWWRWYAWPAWYLTKADSVFLILIGIDLMLGPCLTLIIANPQKTWRELSHDLGFIAVIQLSALIWGIHTLWQGRPVYIAYAIDRFNIVQATQIPSIKQLEALKFPEAQSVDAIYTSDPWRPLTWVWAKPPTDRGERSNLLFAALTGADLHTLPHYYHSLITGKDEMLKRAASYEQLRIVLEAQQKGSLPIVADPARLSCWPISGAPEQERFGIVCLDRTDLSLQSFTAIDDPFKLEVWPSSDTPQPPRVSSGALPDPGDFSNTVPGASMP